MEAATRLLAEAARCGVVSETDIVGFRLAAAAAQCRDWQRRAKAVLAHLQPSSPVRLRSGRGMGMPCRLLDGACKDGIYMMAGAVV